MILSEITSAKDENLEIIFYILSSILLGPLSPIKSMARGRIWVRNVVLFPFILPFFTQLYLQTKSQRDKVISALILPLGILALLLTQTRTAWIGTAFAFLLLFLFNYFWFIPSEKKKKFLSHTLLILVSGLCLLALIITLFFSHTFLSFWRLRFTTFKFLKYDPALLARQLGIHESKVLFSKAPLFGGGLGAAWHSIGYPMSSTDNFYCVMLVKFGIIGALFYLIPYLLWGIELAYTLKRVKKLQNPIHSALLIAIAFFYPSIFIMQFATAHLFNAPSIVIATLSLMAFTDFTYRKLKVSEKL